MELTAGSSPPEASNPNPLHSNATTLSSLISMLVKTTTPLSKPEAPSNQKLPPLLSSPNSYTNSEKPSPHTLHIDKIRILELALQEQEAMRKQEDDFDDDNLSVSTIFYERRWPSSCVASSTENQSLIPTKSEEDEEQVLAAEEEDESREKVDEIDGLEETTEDERRQRQDELSRPWMAEPPGLDMSDTSRNWSKTLTASYSPSPGVSKEIVNFPSDRPTWVGVTAFKQLQGSSGIAPLCAEHDQELGRKSGEATIANDEPLVVGSISGAKEKTPTYFLGLVDPHLVICPLSVLFSWESVESPALYYPFHLPTLPIVLGSLFTKMRRRGHSYLAVDTNATSVLGV
ncbi:hypothetical protein VKT23_006586 [Stygiomarasmius scandens]|uniref:Uncharacterized protein n=1 Tax=Marasmiellus scandens TaxID=2682957 RepID=A0ABR1JNV6_9AGAR